jgi:hypothetical protein
MKYILIVFVLFLIGCGDSSSSSTNSHNVNSSVILKGIDYGYSAYVDINNPPIWHRWLAVTQSDGTLRLNLGVKNPADGKIDPIQNAVIDNVPNALGSHTGCSFRYQPHSGGTGANYASYPESKSLTVTLTSIASNSGEFYEGSFSGPMAFFNGNGTAIPFTGSGSFRLLKK